MKRFPPFGLDAVNQCLWRDDVRVPLMPKPFAVLQYLVDHSGRLVTHDELLSALWPDTHVQPEVLRRYVLEIRRALGDDAEAPRFVQTFPKRGYQFIAPIADPAVTAVGNLVSEPSSTFVGRAAARTALNAHLSTARGGRRQLVFVVGEPGIGKTCLMDVFQNDVSAHAASRTARGHCAEGFGSKEPYYPILEALAQLIRGEAGRSVVEVLAAHAPTWLVQFPSLVRTDQQAALQREIAGATRERMVRELCEALEILTQPSSLTLVVVLEDLQWVDRSTLDLISTVARRREPARLLVVGTLRPADLILAEHPLKSLKQDLLLHRLCHEIPLERLQESDAAAYLLAAGASADVSEGLARVIHRHSDGNPLFMIAMLDHLEQQGILRRASDGWTTAVALDEVNPGLPDTLKQMLEIQLQHATDAEQELLMCASVVGLRFTLWSIEMMLAPAAGDYEAMCRTLAERQQFIRFSGIRDRPDGGPTAEYQFRHALYREVLKRRLAPGQRMDYHRRLAQGFDALATGPAWDVASEIALHFEEAREYEHAIRYLSVAAQNATRRYAHHESVATLEHARALVPRLAPERQAPVELQLLEQAGNALYAMGNMTRSAEAYDEMARRAAAAGQLAVQAEALVRHTHTAEAIPFLLRAVEIDPNLVSAYTNLSRIYSNLGEADRARVYARLAFERREHATDRERLSIEYQFHYEVTGDQSRATETLKRWKRAFPTEFQPVNSLTLIHNFLGRFERAIEEGEEAVRRDPQHGYPYSNLAHAYRGLGRYDDARGIAERAVALGIETLPTRRLLFQLAMLSGDADTAAAHVEWSRDKPREYDMVGARAQVAGWFGRAREARRLYAEAAELASRRNLPDVGANHLAWATWMELAHGWHEQARAGAFEVLSRSSGYDSRLRVALVLALTGCPGEAEAIVVELTRANPDHTLINAVLAPIVRAALDLARADPKKAIETLQMTASYERGFIAALAPLYLRAQAQLMLGAGNAAVDAFQRLLDTRGSDPFSAFHGVALVGLARAHALAGDVRASRAAYERFFVTWATADPDVPILQQARTECGQLPPGKATEEI
jgi:DNA-binding winged helix-turn-helix (wHTH) protein/tetratricopeptide (TPR) repeat protein